MDRIVTRAYEDDIDWRWSLTRSPTQPQFMSLVVSYKAA